MWEALLRVFLQKQWESDPSTAHITEQIREILLSSIQQKTSQTTAFDLKTQIVKLKAAFQSCKYCNSFAHFLEELSTTDSTCRFWVLFVLRDALAYVGLYLAVLGGYWDLRMASLKLMAPLFSALITTHTKSR